MSPKKQTIFHIIQSLGNGGCENMLLRTLPLLTDYDHIILTLKESGDLAPRFRALGIVVHNIAYRHFFSLRALWRLRQLIKTKRPSLVLTYLFHADLIGRLFLPSDPPLFPFLRTTYNHPRYRIARFFEWLTQPFVRHSLVNSEAVKNFYEKHLRMTKGTSTVIPNGIDTDFFQSLLPQPELRASLGIAPTDTVIICVANFHPNKGHTYLLAAFEETYKKHGNLTLLLVGDGEERSSLKKQALPYTSQKNILFLGQRTDVPALLKLSDIFILPTLFEGMSNALLEAMACGLPIITTAIEENRELLTEGYTALLVPPKNTSALNQALETLLSQPLLRTTLSKNASTLVAERFALKRVVRLWQEVLKKCAQPS